MQSKTGIAVSSELMAILAVAKDLPDLRERLSKIVVAYDKKGNPITTADLEVDGAMCAWMRNTINPTSAALWSISRALSMPVLC